MSYSHYIVKKEKERNLNIFVTKIHRQYTKMALNLYEPFDQLAIMLRHEAGRENRNQRLA